MKIAYIIPGIPQTGPVVVVQNLVRNLIKQVEEIDVYYLYDVEKPVSFDCNIHRISYHTPIRFDDYDVIHAHTAKADLYCTIWSWKIKKAKLITTIHQDTFVTERYRIGKFMGPIYVYIWMFLQNLCFDGIVFISKQIYDIYSQYYKCRKAIIYNGVYCDYSIPVNNTYVNEIKFLKDKGLKLLGTYALIVKRKGIKQVIHFLEQNETFGLVVIGDGDEKANLIELSKKKGVNNRILFLPHVTNPYCYLEYIDVYTMTSYSEAFGLAMVEAALSGKPIVCSNLPSFHEIFTEDEACFFELDDIKSLGNAIQKAYSEKNKYGNKAKQKAINYFTARINAKNHLSFYELLLKE